MVKRIGVKSIFILIGLEKAMAKYKSYDYAQRVMIPVSLEEQLVPGTLDLQDWTPIFQLRGSILE